MKTAAALSFVLLLSLGAGPVGAEVQTKNISYKDGDTELQGYLAWDDATDGTRPGVLVVHEWWGLNDYAKKRARELAKLGYVAFAADMYGKGKVTSHPKKAKQWLQQIEANVGDWQRRALAALEVLRNQEQVDKNRVAAIGYCFGGATVMQMAYSGADLDGVVSFHGSLPVATAAQQKQIKARVLAAHGSQDPFTTTEKRLKFQSALDEAGVDWTMLVYGGTRHSFTNPNADQYGMKQLRYNPKAAKDSWQAMQDFFDEIFKESS